MSVLLSLHTHDFPRRSMEKLPSMNRFGGIILLVFAAIWGWYWLQVRTRVETVVRRELQAFEMSHLNYLTSARSRIDPVIWSFMVSGTEESNLSLMASRGGETFEQMRARHAEYVKIPIWPGLLAFITGIIAVVWTPNIEQGRRTMVSSPPAI